MISAFETKIAELEAKARADWKTFCKAKVGGGGGEGEREGEFEKGVVESVRSRG